MKLLSLGVLFTIPAFLLAQEPIAVSGEAHSDVTGAAADSPADSTPASTLSEPALDTPSEKVRKTQRTIGAVS